MPLNKLDNFIKNVEGRILYVNPNDLDSTDSIENQGNSLARPFKTIQRALLESARFSYVKGNNNDIVEKTTILVFPAEHVIDNRPGYLIYKDGQTAKVVPRSGGIGLDAKTELSLTLDTNFDITQEDNDLYKFNSYYGGVIIPRGTSIVGLDLRKTKVRPKYIPNPTDDFVNRSSIFKITGACYFWQFSFLDGDESGLVYTDPNDFSAARQSTPLFSHHKLSCFEYADGVNKIKDPLGNYELTDLDMYYSKVSNAFNAYRLIDDEDKFPENPDGFRARLSEWEIVGAFSSDPIEIESIISGNGSTASTLVTVTTKTEHNLNFGTPIKIKDVGNSNEVAYSYNISTKVQRVISPTQFTYLLPSFPLNLDPTPTVSASTVTVETDTVSGASPYIFNCSLRSVWGLNGMIADGSKASGFRSMVVAQFTGVSLQKDDRAFAKYNKSSRTYDTINVYAPGKPANTPVYGPDLSTGSSQTDSSLVYHLDSDAIYRKGWESSHIKITNNAFIQIVSVFAIGYNKHFDVQSGGDASITNSNSNFGQIALSSDGFRNEAFDKDDKAYITSIITPRELSSFDEEEVFWVSLDVGVTTQTTAYPDRLYLRGFTSEDNPPTSLTQGYRIGARLNDKLYVKINDIEYSSSIYMADTDTSSVKSYTANLNNATSRFTIGPNSLVTGEKILLISEDGNLPENIEAHKIYYAIVYSADPEQIYVASSSSNALSEQYISINGGTNLKILSRVSDKESGETGSPIQFDDTKNNWYIQVNSGNQIYSQFVGLGTQLIGESTDVVYIKRVSDDRSLDEKLYKVRVVIPKEARNSKNPETGFVIQESSRTGIRSDADLGLPTINAITNQDFDYNRNLRLISSCAFNSGTNLITATSELSHNLNVGDIVNIKNVKSSTNTSGENNLGYNGTFRVSQILNDMQFTYSNLDIFEVVHTPGTFTSVNYYSGTGTNPRNYYLPRFERNDLQSNFYIYRNETISPYIEDVQDGIYHLYVLNADNQISNQFTDLKYSQNPVDLYPQLDRDNLDTNPAPAKTYAKVSPLGDVVTNDLKKSVTRETLDKLTQDFGVGLSIQNASSSTITFDRNHGLGRIVSGSLSGPNSGFGAAGTYYNVKLLSGATWKGATVKLVMGSGGAIQSTSIEIISGGSGYSVGEILSFDSASVGGGSATFTVSAVSSNINNVIQFTGDGNTADTYHRITAITPNTVSIARTSGDVSVSTDQYAFIVGPSVRISSNSALLTYDSTTGTTKFTTTTAHGLVVGNKFRVTDVNSNNLGDYIVSSESSVTEFTAITNKSLSAVNGYILKHGFSSNGESSDSGGENLGARGVSFFDNEVLTLTSSVSSNTASPTTIQVSSTSSTSLRIPLGSYIQIGNEILRVSSTGNTTISVLRGELGTRQEFHPVGSLIRKIKPRAVEFRRPSILRASGHTFEYLGYGPGNYSTGLPQVQVKTISDREAFLVQSQERSCGTVIYNGINNSGDVFNGNTKTSAASGEVISYDIPNPTVTGQNSSKLSVVFDEVTIKERLLVEGGNSGNILSQFDGPVNFNKEIRFKDKATFKSTVRIANNTTSTSKTTGALVVDGGVGIGGTVSFGDNIKIGDISAQTSTDSGVIFSGINGTGGLFTEVNTNILSYGINVSQVINPRNSSKVGGIFRLDTRPSGSLGDSSCFVVKYAPVGIATTTPDGEKNGIVISLQNGQTYLVPDSGNTLVGLKTDTGTANQKLQIDGGVYISGNLGVGKTNPSEKVDVDGTVKATDFSGFGIVPIGGIVPWVGNVTSIPDGWALCNGQELLITDYQVLSSIISTRYGSLTNGSGGSGTTHFRVPNIVERFPRGTSSNTRGSSGSDSHIHGSASGSNGTTEGTILGLNQIPQHNHGTDGGDATGTQSDNHRHLEFVNSRVDSGSYNFDSNINNPQSRAVLRFESSSEGNDNDYYIKGYPNFNTLVEPNSFYTSENNANHTHSLTSQGGGQSHNHEIQSASNLPRYVEIPYIIRVK